MVDVSQSRGASTRFTEIGLIDDRGNGPVDDIPFPDSERNDRLNVQDVLITIVGTDSKIGVVLERNAYQAADRILNGLG